MGMCYSNISDGNTNSFSHHRIYLRAVEPCAKVPYRPRSPIPIPDDKSIHFNVSFATVRQFQSND